jgi:hypothetical protein
MPLQPTRRHLLADADAATAACADMPAAAAIEAVGVTPVEWPTASTHADASGRLRSSR